MVKLSLQLSARLNSELEEIAGSLGISKSDLLRRGIQLLSIANEARKKNQKLALIDENRRLIAEILGL